MRDDARGAIALVAGEIVPARRLLAVMAALTPWLLGCAGAAAPVAPMMPAALRSRIDTAEAVALEALAARLSSMELWRGRAHVEDDTGDLAATHPGMGYEDLVLDGAVLATTDLGSHRAERTLRLWSASGYAILGWDGASHVAHAGRYHTAGAIDARCDGCVVERAGELAVHGIFRSTFGDGSERTIAIDADLVAAAPATLTDEELALLFRGLEEGAFLPGVGAGGETTMRRDGGWLVLEGPAGSETETPGPATHGCVDVLGYRVRREIDLRDPSVRRVTVLELGAHTIRCCPRDATGSPCSPGPTCDVRPAEETGDPGASRTDGTGG